MLKGLQIGLAFFQISSRAEYTHISLWLVTGDIPQPVISKLDNIVQEGTTLNIKCSTLGTFSKLSWIKEGAPVPAERVSDIKPEFRDGTVVVESVLKIEDVKLADVGTYTCKSVSRFDASKTAQASVSVNVKGMFVTSNDNTL